MQGNAEVWNLLKNATETDSATAEAILKAAGLKIHAGVMTLVIDERNFPYRIPIYIMHDPKSFLPTEMERLDMVEKPDEEQYENMKIRAVGEQDYEFETSNYTLICDLKVQYLDDTEKSEDYDIDHCVFLFGGKKLDNQLPLYCIFNLHSNMVIQ